MNKIKVVGIGPGAMEYITPAALNAIMSSEMLIGGKRNLEVLSFLEKEVYEFSSGMEEMALYIDKNRRLKKVCVVVSGDPGFYSMLDFLLKRFGRNELEVIPGISSFQYLFCKLSQPWKDYSLVSLHGRTAEISDLLENRKGVFLLTDKTNTPTRLAKKLIEAGFKNCKIIIGENLSYEDEKITELNIEDIDDRQFSDLCVVVIEKNEVEL